MHELSSRTRCSSVRLVSQRPFTVGVCKILEKGGGGPFGICWQFNSLLSLLVTNTSNFNHRCSPIRKEITEVIELALYKIVVRPGYYGKVGGKDLLYFLK